MREIRKPHMVRFGEGMELGKLVQGVYLFSSQHFEDFRVFLHLISSSQGAAWAETKGRHQRPA